MQCFAIDVTVLIPGLPCPLSPITNSTRCPPASARAQLRRLQDDEAGSKADLDTAISLAGAWLDAHRDARDAGAPAQEAAAGVQRHRNVLKQAHTQRALYYKYVAEKTGFEAAAAAAAARVSSRLPTACRPFNAFPHSPHSTRRLAPPRALLPVATAGAKATRPRRRRISMRRRRTAARSRASSRRGCVGGRQCVYHGAPGGGRVAGRHGGPAHVVWRAA
jgi:hypothetical protein